MNPLKTAVHNADSIFEFPEIMPGADAWLWSDEPSKGTVVVTEDGLRRLLRLVSKMQGCLMYLALGGTPDLRETFMRDLTDVELRKMLNDSSGIFCEGNLVVSRLFVDADGCAIAHSNPEVDK